MCHANRMHHMRQSTNGSETTNTTHAATTRHHTGLTYKETTQACTGTCRIKVSTSTLCSPINCVGVSHSVTECVCLRVRILTSVSTSPVSVRHDPMPALVNGQRSKQLQTHAQTIRQRYMNEYESHLFRHLLVCVAAQQQLSFNT